MGRLFVDGEGLAPIAMTTAGYFYGPDKRRPFFIINPRYCASPSARSALLQIALQFDIPATRYPSRSDHEPASFHLPCAHRD
jgi:hypothetical protein